MLSYLHAFHAGNFADVQKHAALSLVLAMMPAKNCLFNPPDASPEQFRLNT